ncbi:MAG: hypothetical protein PHW53_01920 [Patescibacteria group bacterium]|nr:hypothetical protein [Patescibacteria group bacterium]
MHQPIYREVLREAWFFAWRNKVLWVFGFFAGLMMSGGIYDLGVKMFGRVTNLGSAWQAVSQGMPFESALGLPDKLSGIKQLFTLENVWLITAVLVALAIGLGLIWLSVASQGALITAAAGKAKNKLMPAGDAFTLGMHKFWPLLGINVSLKVAIALLVMFTTFPLFLLLSANIALNAALYLVSFLIFIPAAVIVYFIAMLASCYVMLRNKGYGSALYHAWELFKRHWLICMELGFLLFVISFLIGLAIVLIFLVISLPIMLLVLAAVALASNAAFLVILILSVLIFAGVMIFGSAFTVTFQYTAWVMLFERLASRGGLSRLARWVHGLANLHEHKKISKRKK